LYFFINKIFLEYGYIGHPDIGSKLSPTVLRIFKDNGIKIKDICCGIKHSIALTGNSFFKIL